MAKLFPRTKNRKKRRFQCGVAFIWRALLPGPRFSWPPFLSRPRVFARHCYLPSGRSPKRQIIGNDCCRLLPGIKTETCESTRHMRTARVSNCFLLFGENLRPLNTRFFIVCRLISLFSGASGRKRWICSAVPWAVADVLFSCSRGIRCSPKFPGNSKGAYTHEGTGRKGFCSARRK